MKGNPMTELAQAASTTEPTAEPTIDPTFTTPYTPKAEPSGFGGWFAFVVLGQTLSPLVLLTQMLMGPDIGLLSNPALPSNLMPLIVFEVGMNVCLIAFHVFVMIVMYRRKRSFPNLYRWQFYIFTAALLADLLMISDALKLPITAVIQSRDIGMFIGMALWTWYVSVSVRVRNTFVK
jgi:hypothetical protein